MTLADGSVHEGEYRGGIKLRRTIVIVISQEIHRTLE